MRLKYWMVIVACILFTPCAVAETHQLASEAAGQIQVEVTVYNQNLGLIKDLRKVAIPKGSGELRFMDVASGINPVTVHVKSLNHADEFSILEQNYEYDLMNENKLLDKYVGREIKLLDTNEFQGKSEEITAELLSNNGGQIYRIDGEIYLGHPGIKILPEIPENLIAKPTLTWLFENRATGEHELEVTYLSSGLNWKSDYVLVLDEKDIAADLSGWVTVNNQSGATYKNAKLKLIAGDVNRASQPVPAYEMKRVMMMDAAGGAQMTEKAFFEYHIYDLQRPTTIKDRQTKQISLLEAQGLSIEKEYIIRGSQGYFRYRYTPIKNDRPFQELL